MKQLRFVEYDNGKVHEKMGDKNTDDDAVGGQQKAVLKTIPADQGGISQEQEKKRDICSKALHRIPEFFQREVKVNETSDRQADKVDDQGVVVGVLVNEADVEKDKNDIEGTQQPQRHFLVFFDMGQPDQDNIEPVRHEDGKDDKDKQDEIPVLRPEAGNVRHIFVNEVIERKEKEYGCA